MENSSNSYEMRKRKKRNLDRNMLLKDFQSNEKKKFSLLVEKISNPEMLESLIFITSYKKLIEIDEDKIFRIINDGNGLFFLIELMKVQCTVNQLLRLMCFREFVPVKIAMGICFESMHVLKQPGTEGEIVILSQGDDLVLDYLVSGIPYPQFEWFCNDSAIENEGGCSLRVQNFQHFNQGVYYCNVLQYSNDVLHKQITSIKIECRLRLSAPVLKTDLLPNLKCEEGTSITLVIEVDDDTNVNYEWICENQIISSSSNTLKFEEVKLSNRGKYCCIASIEGLSTVSTVCNLEVCKSQTLGRILPVDAPSMKLALLIGNNDYSDCPKLGSSVNDVMIVAKCLKELKFHIVNFINLDKTDMISVIKMFAEFITPSSYVFFYFSGHGFIHAANKFMMPIDSPSHGSYQCSDCIHENFLKQHFFSKNPRLYIEVLDMCLTGSQREENPRLFDNDGQAVLPHYDFDNSKTTTVRAYPTKEYQKTYENNKDDSYLSYSKCLSAHLALDLPINKVFLDAHKSFSEKNKTQHPSFFTEDSANSLNLNISADRRKLGSEHLVSNLKLHCLAMFEPEKYTILTDKYSATITVRPSSCFILNTVDVLIETDCAESLRISVEEIGFVCEIQPVSSETVFTIPNLQKISGETMSLKLSVYNEDNFVTARKPSLF